jgi:hypothetical protein
VNQILFWKSAATPHGPEPPVGRVHSVSVALDAAATFETVKLDERTSKKSRVNTLMDFAFMPAAVENMYCTAWLPKPTVKEFSPSRKNALANLSQRERV